MLSSNLSNFMLVLSVVALPTVFSIVFHEVMHGEVARHLGDDTAQRAGRLTLNPISHVDLFGTIILPALLVWTGLPVFGWAKPVPVDFRRLRNGRAGMVMVAAAGPLTNLALAVISAILLRWFPLGPDSTRFLTVPLHYMLQFSVKVNVVLAIFNLIPLLPLAVKFARLERYGFLILFALLLWPDFFTRFMDPIINTVTRMLL